jgi:hypothetical protein
MFKGCPGNTVAELDCQRLSMVNRASWELAGKLQTKASGQLPEPTSLGGFVHHLFHYV